MITSIAERTHCEHPMRPASDGRISYGCKFAVGDKVDLSPRDRFVGTVKAVFTTKEGETRYAVDVEGSRHSSTMQ